MDTDTNTNTDTDTDPNMETTMGTGLGLYHPDSQFTELLCVPKIQSGGMEAMAHGRVLTSTKQQLAGFAFPRRVQLPRGKEAYRTGSNSANSGIALWQYQPNRICTCFV